MGACVYLNTLPAMLWWCTRLVYMTNKNIRDKILCCFMESPLSFSLKPFYSDYVHMWSYFCLLMLDSVFILLSDSIKISEYILHCYIVKNKKGPLLWKSAYWRISFENTFQNPTAGCDLNWGGGLYVKKIKNFFRNMPLNGQISLRHFRYVK